MNHLLEAGPLIICAGEGPILVDVQNLNPVAFGKELAGFHLLLDGNIPLGVAGVTGVYDSFGCVLGFGIVRSCHNSYFTSFSSKCSIQ